MGIRQSWTLETYWAFRSNVEKERKQKLEAQAIAKQAEEAEEDEKTRYWKDGLVSAQQRATDCPDTVPHRLLMARKELACQLHWADLERSAELQAIYDRKQEMLKGEIQALEHYCHKNGINVPTAEEREREAIDRIVEMQQAAL